MMKDKLKLLIDFDDTIYAYSDKIGNLMPGTKEALQKLIDLGFELVIYSARLSTPENTEFHQNQLETIADFVLYYKLPIKGVTGRKLHAWGYIDDRTFRFKGNWKETIKEIKEQLITEGKMPYKSFKETQELILLEEKQRQIENKEKEALKRLKLRHEN